jgi:salicylate hydroxylase
MSFEDGAVLGECLSRLPNSPDTSKTLADFLVAKKHALCRLPGVSQATNKDGCWAGEYTTIPLYHLHDSAEQEERDRKMQMVPTPEGEALAWRDPGLAPKLLGYDHIADLRVRFTC